MRNLVASTCALFVLTACPSDDASDDTGAGTDMTTMSGTGMSGTGMSGTGMSSTGMTSMSTTDGTDGMTTTGMTSAEDSTTSGGETAAAGGPTINSITWTHVEGCTMNTGSDVEIVIDATDPDNDASELTVSGMLVGCTGEVNALTSTILCPQVAPYTGAITVADPDGNEDDLDITIEPCVDGSAMP